MVAMAEEVDSRVRVHPVELKEATKTADNAALGL